MTALGQLLMRCAEIPVRVRNTGIYFLLLDERIVYVGQSCDVILRIGQHVSQLDNPFVEQPRGVVPNIAHKPFDRAIWFPVAETDLDAYEGALIRALAPPLNFQAPLDHGRDVEVLGRLGLEPNEDARLAFEAKRHARYSMPRIRCAKARHPRDTRWRQRDRARRLWSAIESLFAARHGAAA